MNNFSKESLSGIWTLLLKKFRITLLLTLFILIWGSVTYNIIPRESTPTIEIPAATITTVWPGANPGDIEKLITNKIEKKIKGIENLKEYASVSLSNVSVVSVEFELETDMTENIQNLREKLDEVKSKLPASIPDDPKLNEVSISDIPLLSLTLSGDYSWSELKIFSEAIEDEIEGVPQVKNVYVKGAPKDEFHILIDPIKLEAKGIGINEVLNAIGSAHKDMPLGIVSVDGQKIEVSVRSELEDTVGLMELPIKVSNGALIKLKEFATITKEFEKFEVETYFSENNGSKPAVLIDVIKSASKGNVLQMVTQIFAQVESLKTNQTIPQNLQINVTYNRADEIQESLDTLTHSGGLTLILIAVVMLLALGWRESLLAALSIPLSMLMAIITLHLLGETFNGVSLFALVLAIGLLVDNSIIIVEGLYSGIHKHKLSPLEAAIYTLKTFRWPIITGTLTTICAFFPMLIFISGVSGQYISVIPITVTTVLVAALFVSLFLLPSIGTYFFQFIPPKKSEAKLLTKFQNWYQNEMKKILHSTKKIAVVLILSFGTFFYSVSLVATSKVPIEVFPSPDQSLFTADIELPTGTSLSETRQLIKPISQALTPYFQPQENGDIFLENFVFTVGKKQDLNRDPGEVSNLPEENVIGLTVNLTEKEDRITPSYEIMPILSKTVTESLPSYVDIKFAELGHGPPSGSPIEIRLMGNDLDHLEYMTEDLKKTISEINYTKNVRDSRAEKTMQLNWSFDRDILANFGLSPVGVLESLRASINGITVIKITEGSDEVDVNLRIDWKGDQKWEDPESLDVLKKIPLKTPAGTFINLGQVAEPKLSSELSQIRHRDGIAVLFVRADLEQGITASILEKELNEAIKQLDKHPGEIIEIGGENEEGRRLMRESAIAMLFSLILIMIVLVWQFDSFYQSFVTIAIIPLSLTGVFIGFWLTQMTISFPTMIGIVSLAGIIVNDAIVLIDRINHHKILDKHWVEAYIDAGKERMQPIFLTSITTVVGMLPLSLSDEVWGGLGFAIVYGMILSTVLTLLLIPCFLAVGHYFSERCQNCFERVRNWL